MQYPSEDPNILWAIFVGFGPCQANFSPAPARTGPVYCTAVSAAAADGA
jgi:hypothetical protein